MRTSPGARLPRRTVSGPSAWLVAAALAAGHAQPALAQPEPRHPAPSAGSPTAASEPDSTLLRIREALTPGIQAAHTTVAGTADYRGAIVPFTLTFDTAGAFRSTLDGPLAMTVGYNGATAWERDWNGTPRILPLGEHDAALLSTWTITGFWADPASGLEFSMPTPIAARDPAAAPLPDDSTTLEFSWPGTPITGRVTIDVRSNLPVRFEWSSGSDTTTQEVSGFGDLQDATLPSLIVQSGTNTDTVTIRLQDAASTSATPAPAATFAPDLTPAADTTFNRALAPEIEVRRAPTGHLLVHPLIAGRDLGWFIFDTGAGSNVLSTPVAQEAGLGPFGSVPARGVGGTTDAHFYRAPSLSLGPVTINDPIFVGIDLAFLDQYMGVRVAGILGYEFLARTVVEFDITAAAIALHDPATYGELTHTQPRDWRDLLLYNRHPCVPASFEGRHGVFNLDTGAAQSFVTFHALATEELSLLDGRDTSHAQLGGVGGTVPARAGTLEWFELGGHRTNSVPASFATQRVGAFADPYLTGTIGGRLMAPFILVLDYSHQRIAFVPRSP